MVDGDDAVQGRFQDRGLARLALAQPGVLLGELALEAAPLHLADLLGLALDLRGLLVELDEAGDLGPQDHRYQRLDQVIDRTQRVGLLD